jgi:signal transduction histidine kinase/CheY-like chemotaxis protein
MGNSKQSPETKRKLLKKADEGYNLRKQLAICSAVISLTLISFLPYMLGLELYDEDPSTPYSGASTDALIDIVNAVLVACMCMMLLEALLDAQSLYIPIKIAFPRFVMVLGVLFTSLAYYLHPYEDNLDRLNFLICSHYARLYVICGCLSFRLLKDATETGRKQWLGYLFTIALYLTELQLKQWSVYFHADSVPFYILRTCVSCGAGLVGIYLIFKIIQLSMARDNSEINLGLHYYNLISNVVLTVFIVGGNAINIAFGFQSWKNTSATEVAGYYSISLFAMVLFFFTSSYISQRHFVKAEGQLINKKSFVRYVSHEIRTPLNTVYLGIQLLSKELTKMNFTHEVTQGSNRISEPMLPTAVLTRLQDIVNDISESCFVSIDILNDLLLIDKIEEGNLNLDMQPKIARNIFEPCINNFEVQAQFSKVDLCVDLDAIAHVTTEVDEGKIVQVVRNIVSNALKFTPKGGYIHIKSYFIPDEIPEPSRLSGIARLSKVHVVSSSAECANSRTSGKVRIEFMDTGPGMSEENKAKLFESVIQFDANVLQSGGGSGLGLFISNAIMKRHSGGCIDVMPGGVSVKGRGGEEGTVHLEASDTSSSGCVFYIEIDGSIEETTTSDEGDCAKKCLNNVVLPTMVANIDGDDVECYVQSVSLATQDSDEGCLFSKILVAEDSMFNRKMMRKALEKYSIDIDMVENGVQAVEAVRRCAENQAQPYDIIFMDSLMPVMNGIEATTIIIKELNFPNPVIAVTGNMLPEDVRNFESAGVLTVLGKPLDLDKLHEVLTGMFMSVLCMEDFILYIYVSNVTCN